MATTPSSSRVEPGELPADALLRRYVDTGAFTDCYAVDARGAVSFARYVEAFYTSAAFRAERVILKWLANRPSTDDDVRRLAAGEVEAFAAWTVEARTADQLLLRDMTGRTRSWLKVEPRGDVTRLYFGSAVVPKRQGTDGRPEMGGGFRPLLGFHRMYSRVLLGSARKRVG